MSRANRNVPAHRRGGQPGVGRKARPKGVTVDSWAGRVHVEWDPEAPLTPIGQASFFIEFLKASGVFDALVADCPLAYMSPNAPNKRDVLGTAVLSMLSGHKRYSHMAALRADHAFLLEGGVFTPDLIDAWIDWKQQNEINPVALRPTPYEFYLYFDV